MVILMNNLAHNPSVPIMSFVLKELQVHLSLKDCAIAAAKDVENSILQQWQ